MCATALLERPAVEQSSRYHWEYCQDCGHAIETHDMDAPEGSRMCLAWNCDCPDWKDKVE